MFSGPRTLSNVCLLRPLLEERYLFRMSASQYLTVAMHSGVLSLTCRPTRSSSTVYAATNPHAMVLLVGQAFTVDWHGTSIAFWQSVSYERITEPDTASRYTRSVPLRCAALTCPGVQLCNCSMSNPCAQPLPNCCSRWYCFQWHDRQYSSGC